MLLLEKQFSKTVNCFFKRLFLLFQFRGKIWKKIIQISSKKKFYYNNCCGCYFVTIVTSSVTRCWNKRVAQISKGDPQQFLQKKLCFSKQPKKPPNSVGYYCTKNYQKELSQIAQSCQAARFFLKYDVLSKSKCHSSDDRSRPQSQRGRHQQAKAAGKSYLPSE